MIRPLRVLAIVTACAASATLGAWSRAEPASTSIVPRLAPFRGNLEENGVPVDGTRSVQFALYAQASGGEALWSETQPSVTIQAGSFTVLLGTVVPIPHSVMVAPALYLELSVGGTVLSGRQRFFAGSAAVSASHGIPPGSVTAYAGGAVPPGWLLCNGAAVSRADYPALLAAIGTAHGSGDGTKTFNLPDYRGRFLRGVDLGAGRDPDVTTRVAATASGNSGDAVGSVQYPATARPKVDFGVAPAGKHNHTNGNYRRLAATCDETGHEHTTKGVDGDNMEEIDLHDASPMLEASDHTHSLTGGDKETRPANAAVNFIIKY